MWGFFQIEKTKKDVFIDAKDETVANWMRFVNCSQSDDTKNVQAIQHNGKIYYWTCRDIEAGEELLVWYGGRYAKILGLLPEDSEESPGIVDPYPKIG